eukprot:4741836-Pleurochrysis_carterae.AAC.1
MPVVLQGMEGGGRGGKAGGGVPRSGPVPRASSPLCADLTLHLPLLQANHRCCETVAARACECTEQRGEADAVSYTHLRAHETDSYL